MADELTPKTGRPTKLTEELIEKANHYIANFQEYGDPAPSIEALSLELGISRSTAYDWASKPNNPFSDILERCNQTQVRTLFRGSLTGEMNAQITKLMLGKQGYSEKLEQAHTSPDGSMSPPTKIELVAKQ